MERPLLYCAAGLFGTAVLFAGLASQKVQSKSNIHVVAPTVEIHKSVDDRQLDCEMSLEWHLNGYNPQKVLDYCQTKAPTLPDDTFNLCFQVLTDYVGERQDDMGASCRDLETWATYTVKE